ncbi:hypothetical protein P4475_05780 [Halalkalibacterium halodurans]|uniref:hypothetical protein n=1 Tax=Halalkalibacterium halodurans TaxID=86665 RepID=UPI0010673BD7|nr:hypothetical protein [Halalkalibacterium halodurans]MED3646332.1 hypothetical protein [Halalkalibacterium halodurans]TES52456.1 hypothetical protein E2L07_14065 [Halalkalibacterium halodurans]
MSTIFLDYQVEIFITMEVLTVICLLLFGVTRYYFNIRKASLLFILLFIGITALEAALAWWLYNKTGEISTLQIIITVFVLYAITFGIGDFKKLDRWMRKKIGGWKGIDLLTEKDRQLISLQKDPAYVARSYRRSSYIHIALFVTAQMIFISMGTDSLSESLAYVKDWSWIEHGTYEQSPYPNETIYSIAMLWGIIFVVDTIYSWSYTVFPKKPS